MEHAEVLGMWDGEFGEGRRDSECLTAYPGIN